MATWQVSEFNSHPKTRRNKSRKKSCYNKRRRRKLRGDLVPIAQLVERADLVKSLAVNWRGNSDSSHKTNGMVMSSILIRDICPYSLVVERPELEGWSWVRSPLQALGYKRRRRKLRGEYDCVT